MVPPESFGTALRRLRLESGLVSLRQFAAAVHYSPAYISEIERGIKRPTIEVAERCDRALDVNGVLVALATAQHLGTVGSHASPTPPVADRTDRFESTPLTVKEVAMAAAHESTSSAAADGSHMLPTMSVEQVRDTAQRLAREYNAGSPLSTLVAARMLRESARQLAESTNKPQQTSDLYQVAGQACGVMSVASFDLAIWPAAIEQARAALVYAELIDDTALQAWSLGTLALTTFWFGRAHEATDLAERGLRNSSAGTARARLLCIAARAWAHVGDAEKARRAMEAADRERQAIGANGHDPLHDAIGGEFGWGPARQAMCDASTWLRLGDADQAASSARTAIRLRTEDQTGFHVDAKAAADLAAAELLRDNLDAVDEVLAPVWDITAEFRGHALVARLGDVGTRLGRDERYREAPQARDLVARIEHFAAQSAPQALPPSRDQFA